MRSDPNVIEVLCLACRVIGRADDVRVTSVDSAAAALAAVRMMPFDVLVTASDIGGGAVWPLAGKVRRVRPRLHWWLIGHALSDGDEVLARTLGVTRILDGVPTAALIHSAFARPVPTRRAELRGAETRPAEQEAAESLALQE